MIKRYQNLGTRRQKEQVAKYDKIFTIGKRFIRKTLDKFRTLQSFIRIKYRWVESLNVLGFEQSDKL